MDIFSKKQFEHVMNINIDKDMAKIINEKKNIESIEIDINNKKRRIFCLPKNSLIRTTQKKIQHTIFSDEHYPDCVCGYVEKKSYFDFLKPHCTKKYFLRIDIKNFFGSISKEHLAILISEKIRVSDSEERKQITNFLLNIFFVDNNLPQGFSTSPVLSNLFFKRADLRIEKYCINQKITYTRYVDDLLFSSNQNNLKGTKVLSTIKYICNDFGLEINYKKIKRGINTFSLNGFVIDNEIRLSRKKLAYLKSFLFFLEQNCHKDNLNLLMFKEFGAKFYYTENILSFLSGYRAFLISSLSNNQSTWNKKCRKIIERIEIMTAKLYKKSDSCKL